MIATANDTTYHCDKQRLEGKHFHVGSKLYLKGMAEVCINFTGLKSHLGQHRGPRKPNLCCLRLCKHGKGSVIMIMGPKSLSGPPTLESKSTQRYWILALLSSPVGDKHLLTAGFIQELVETDICQYGFNGSSGFSI